MILRHLLRKIVLTKKLVLTIFCLISLGRLSATSCPELPLPLGGSESVSEVRAYISKFNLALVCKKDNLMEVARQRHRLVNKGKDKLIHKISAEHDSKITALLEIQWQWKRVEQVSSNYQNALEPEKRNYIQLMKTFVTRYRPSAKKYGDELSLVDEAAKNSRVFSSFYVSINRLTQREHERANAYIFDVSFLTERLTSIHNSYALDYNPLQKFMAKHKLVMPDEVTRVMIPSLKRIIAYIKQRKLKVRMASQSLRKSIKAREIDLMDQKLSAEIRESQRLEQILHASIEFSYQMRELIKKAWVEPKVNAYGFELPLLEDRYHNLQILLSFEPLCKAGKGDPSFWMGQGCLNAESEFRKAHNYIENILPMLTRNYVMILEKYNPEQKTLVEQIKNQLDRKNFSSALAGYDLFLRLGGKK